MLTDNERLRVIDGVDADALEGFLLALPAAERSSTKASFLKPLDDAAPHPDGVWSARDPALEALLADVWAPRRGQLNDDPAFWRQIESDTLFRKPIDIALINRLDEEHALADIRLPATSAERELVLMSVRTLSAEVLITAIEAIQDARLSHHDDSVKGRIVRIEDIQFVRKLRAAEPHLMGQSLEQLEIWLQELARGPLVPVSDVGLARMKTYRPGGSREPIRYPAWDPRWRPPSP